MQENILDERFWNSRYESKDMGWDIGYASTPLKKYFNQLTDKSMRILIPGCGNAYEAKYLLEQGFTNITLVDISSRAIESLHEKLKDYDQEKLRIIHGDFFDLDAQYDLIVEQTFFCALEPSLREAYMAKMKTLLNEGGKLAGVLFNRSFEAGPPFGGKEAEYRALLKKYFNIQLMEPAHNSIPPRAGTELFFIAVREGSGAAAV